MSFWSDFLGWIGIGGSKPPKPPQPEPQRGVGFLVKDPVAGQLIPIVGAKVTLDSKPTPFVGTTDNDGYLVFHNVPAGMTASHVWVKAEGFKDYSQHVDLKPGNQNLLIGETHAAPNDTILPPLEHVGGGGVHPGRRTGIVRAEGRHYADDQGRFQPLGYSLFWALRGWKFERDRVKQNIDYIAKAGFDYYRVLGEVGWTGLFTDPRWPDYKQLFAELIDWSYDVAGIRVQITCIGGATGCDYNKLMDDIIEIVKPRAEKVIFVEVANEWYANFKDEEKLKSFGKKLKAALPNLVVCSAPAEELAWDKSKEWVNAGACNATVAHFARTDNKTDWKWRHVRKPWESRNPSVPSSSNEPGGPRSSVAQYEESMHLVMARAVGILCGYDAYVYHNGSGIYGVYQDKYGGRFPNVWETPGTQQHEQLLRTLDSILPEGPSNGSMTRKGLGAHPLTADVNWPDGGDHGIVRDYAITNGGSFWQALQGIKNYVNLKSNGDYTLTLIDPITHETETREVSNGQTIRVEPKSRDSRGYGAFIIRGVKR